MTSQGTPPPDQPQSQSLSASPTDEARTYQTGRDQTINEHHHYAPRGSLKPGIAWSLAGAMILALGTFVGVDLWQRHTAADASPAGDAKAQSASSASSTPSSTAKPTRTASPTPTPTPVASHEERPASAEAATPPASSSGPPPNPAKDCTTWRNTAVSHVQVKPCARIDDGVLYMGAEWRTTTGSALVDVYVWLEDSSGGTVVYPAASVSHGMAAHSMAAWPTPVTKPQWKEYEVGESLVHGELYQVSVSVQAKGAPGPNIANPATKGFQLGVVYT